MRCRSTGRWSPFSILLAGVEFVEVSVPLLERGREFAVGLGETFDGGNSFGTGHRLGDAGFIASVGGFTADQAGHVEGVQGVFGRPARAVPAKPLAPLCNEPQIGFVTVNKNESKKFFGVCGRGRAAAVALILRLLRLSYSLRALV